MTQTITPAAPPETEAFDAFLSRYAGFAEANNLLPVKITPFYQAKLQQEFEALGHRNGPLNRVAYPPAERLQRDPTQSDSDFLGDRIHQKQADKASRAVIHKYDDRLLFMPTTACAGHCQYCFRQDYLTDGPKQSMLQFEARLLALGEYLQTVPNVREVILSGGDPMTLSTNQFRRIFEMLKQHPTVTDIRLHTRGLVFAPQTLEDPAKIALFKENNVRMVFHIAHPYEMCARVEETLAKLNAAGLRLYNQFPVLRGINDHKDVLKLLLNKLDDAHIRPLSVFAPDPVSYTHPYRVSVARLLELMDSVRRSSPAWISNVPLVFDTAFGKVYRDNMLSLNDDGTATFRRGDKEFTYPGFPPHLDVAGDAATMLWQQA